MLNYYNNPVVRDNKDEMNMMKISSLESRLNRSKASITKLKSALSSIKNNDKLRKRFEDRIVEESEIALGILLQIKLFRKELAEKNSTNWIYKEWIIYLFTLYV